MGMLLFSTIQQQQDSVANVLLNVMSVPPIFLTLAML